MKQFNRGSAAEVYNAFASKNNLVRTEKRELQPPPPSPPAAAV